MTLSGSDFSNLDLYWIYDALTGSGTDGITEEQMYKVLNGSSGFGKPEGLFDPATNESYFVDAAAQNVFIDPSLNKGLAEMLGLYLNSIDSNVISLLAGTNEIVARDVYTSFREYRNTAASAKTLVEAVVTGKFFLTGLNVYNPNTTTAFLKFYDAANTGAVTIGTTATAYIVQIPPQSSVILESSNSPKCGFNSGIVIAALTGYLETDVTPPATGLFISKITFKNLVV